MSPLIIKELIRGATEIFTTKEGFKENLAKPSSFGGYGLIAFGLNYLPTDQYIGLGLVTLGVVAIIFRRSPENG